MWKISHLWLLYLSIPALASVSELWVTLNISSDYMVHQKLPFHSPQISVFVYKTEVQTSEESASFLYLATQQVYS